MVMPASRERTEVSDSIGQMDLFGATAKRERDRSVDEATREQKQATRACDKAVRIQRRHFDVAVGLVEEERVAAMLTECFDGVVEALGGPARR